MSKKVLGLDVSTHMGMVLLTKESLIYEMEYSAPKNVKGIKRIQSFLDHTYATLVKHSPDLVAIEGYGFSNKHTIVTLVELGTAVRLACHHAMVPYIEVPPTSLKKFVTGKGNAKKDQMMLQVFKKWDYEAGTDNLADGYALAQFGLAWLREIPLSVHAATVVTKVSPPTA